MTIKVKKYGAIADQVVFSGTSFATTIVLARQLDPAGFGQYSVWLLGIYLAVCAIGAWSVQPFQVHAGRVSSPRTYASFVFWGHVALAFAGVLGAAVVLWALHCPEVVAPLFFGLGFVLYDGIRKILLAQNRPGMTLIIDLLSGILTGCVLLVVGNPHVAPVMAGLGAVYAFVFILSVALIRPFAFDSTAFKTYFQYHIRQGKWYFLTAISQWWAGNLLVVASGALLGPVALGALRLSQSLFGVLNMLLQTFENYILPQTASKINQNFAAGLDYLKKTSLRGAAVYFPLLLLIYVGADNILMLAGGSEYAGYAYVLQGLSVLYVFVGIGQPVRCMIRSLELHSVFFRGYLMTLGFALCFSQPLIRQFGLPGVLAGLIISQIILIIYWGIILHTNNKISWKSFISF